MCVGSILSSRQPPDECRKARTYFDDADVDDNAGSYSTAPRHPLGETYSGLNSTYMGHQSVRVEKHHTRLESADRYGIGELQLFRHIYINASKL